MNWLWGRSNSSDNPNSDSNSSSQDNYNNSTTTSNAQLSADQIREQRAKRLMTQVAARTTESPEPTTTPKQTRPDHSTPTQQPTNTSMSIPSSPVASSSRISQPQQSQPKSASTFTSTISKSPPNSTPILQGSAATNSPSTPTSSQSSLSSLSSLISNILPSWAVVHHNTNIDDQALESVWQSECICDILQVSIDERSSSRTSEKRQYLEDCARDALDYAQEHSQSFPVLRFDQLDSVLIERLSLPLGAYSSAIGYLVACYRKGYDLLATLQSALNQLASHQASNPNLKSYPNDSKTVEDCFRFAESLLMRIVSFVGMTLSDEDNMGNSSSTYSRESASLNEFLRLLRADPRISRTLPPGFLERLAKHLDKDLLYEMINPVLETFVVKPTHPPPTMEDSRSVLQALSVLVKVPAIAHVVVDSPHFNPSHAFNGRMFQLHSILAAHLSHCAVPTEPVFQQPTSKARDEVDNATARLRSEFQSYYTVAGDVFRGLVKADAYCRDRTLQWVETLCRLNVVRRRTHYDPHSVSTESLLLTVGVVMVQLSMPIIVPREKKSAASHISPYDKVSLNYLVNPIAKVNYNSVTRIAATEKDVTAVQKEQANLSTPPIFNFSTECFFLTMECLHIGLMNVTARYTEVMVKINRLNRQLHENGIRIGVDRNHPLHYQFDSLLAQTLALNVHLLDETLIVDAMTFYDFAAAYTVHTVTSHSPLSLLNVRSQTSTAASSAASSTGTPVPPSAFIPEYFVVNITDFSVFLGRFNSAFSSLSSFSFNGLCSLLVTLASGPYAVRNPHIKGKFAEVILSLIMPSNSNSEYSPMSSAFTNNPLFRKRLIPMLLELFVEVEFGPRMYFEKYSIRHWIATVIEYLWSVTETSITGTHSSAPEFPYRFQLKELANSDAQLFVRFTNAMTNDLIYLLDESLKHLTQIHEYELRTTSSSTTSDNTSPTILLPETSSGSNTNDQPSSLQSPLTDESGQPVTIRHRPIELTEQERQEQFQQSEQFLDGMMRLANSTVHMLYYMTSEMPEPFLSKAMVERMSSMVAYYINKLVGPTISDLKVRNREKYHFHPRTLLREMLKIFLHLSVSSEFLEAIARDERSYSRDIFSRALSIGRRRAILTHSELKAFSDAIDQVGEISDSMIALEDALNDVPEKYLDSLLSTLMSDPVTLPTTKMTVDRLTIQRHLMNSSTDPFSRAPLTEDQLIEEPDLKKEIEQWVAERKEAFRESKRALKEQQDNEDKEKQRTELANATEQLSSEEQDVRHRTNVVNAMQFSNEENSMKTDEEL